MNIFEAIATRRSIRKFTDEVVSDAQVTQILEAGMAAPSAGNAQPWRFIVVREKQAMEDIAKLHPYAQMAKESSVCIAVCADTQVEKHAGFWVQDCSAAIQNMLLAARGLGIGTVWTGITPVQERAAAFKEFFALPDHVEILGIVVCGYPDQPFKARDTFDAGKVFTEKWGQ